MTMQLNNIFSKIYKNFLSLIFQNSCSICNKTSEDVVCKDCESRLKFIKEPICYRCGRPLPANLQSKEGCRECQGKKFSFSSARSILYYSGEAEKSIKNYKYKRNKNLAKYYVQSMKKFSYDGLFEKFINGNNYLVPVPMHPIKEWKRGFNQATLFAFFLSKDSKIPICDMLYKKSNKKPQSLLSLKERKIGVKGDFSIKNDHLIKGKNILLIDDVFTTGSTVNECAKILKKNGASDIKVLTIARSVLEY